MALTTNKQLDKVSENRIRAFDNHISNIEGILKFTIGEPDFNAPKKVKEAAIKAVEEDYSHYAPSSGYPILRQEIANFMNRHYDLDYNPDNEILVTVGASEGIALVCHGLLNPGEKVLIPSPYFSLYQSSIISAHGEPVYISTSDSGFKLTPEKLTKALKEHPETKVLFLNYPSNPTGVTYTDEELKALGEIAREFDIFVMADEIYSELVYDDVEHASIAKHIPERTIIINGASKAYAMTGYRIGYLAYPAFLNNAFGPLHQVFVTCVPSVDQMAAVTAFRDCDEDIAVMREAYKKRRDYLIPELEALGFEIAEPKGAFYLFLKIPADQNQNDTEFAFDVAEKAKVGLTPGSAFGLGGEGYLRMSYAASIESLQQGIANLKEYFGK